MCRGSNDEDGIRGLKNYFAAAKKKERKEREQWVYIRKWSDHPKTKVGQVCAIFCQCPVMKKNKQRDNMRGWYGTGEQRRTCPSKILLGPRKEWKKLPQINFFQSPYFRVSSLAMVPERSRYIRLGVRCSTKTNRSKREWDSSLVIYIYIYIRFAHDLPVCPNSPPFINPLQE